MKCDKVWRKGEENNFHLQPTLRKHQSLPILRLRSTQCNKMVSGRSSTGSSESSSSCSFGGGPVPDPILNNGESSAPVPQIQVDMTHIDMAAATNGQPENNNHVLITLQEKRVIAEFCHLLEKSKQLFNQLRCVLCSFLIN